jgi:hypothetical protein
VDEIYRHDVYDTPGVYILHRRIDGSPRYVGRSGSRVYARLRGREYTYYQFKPCRSDYDAYKWECRYWHKYNDTLDNGWANGGNHPAGPAGSNHRCPVCEW